mmetsp:Transcript_49774/g.115515  ORF Transcript_49774/g.115515 Transcript_49774/m.115515 type:complete len:218 (+) Transcript_49774:1830-2483(+)
MKLVVLQRTVLQARERDQQWRNQVLHVRRQLCCAVGCLDHLSHHVKAQRLSMLVPLTELQKQRHNRLHCLFSLSLEPRCLDVHDTQREVPEHPHKRLRDGLNPLLHVVHQLHHNCPEILKDEGNLAPRPPSKEDLGSLDRGFPCGDTGTPQSRNQVLRDGGPLLRELGGQLLGGFHAEVAGSQLDDRMPKRPVRVEEVWVELWPDLLWAEVFSHIVG